MTLLLFLVILSVLVFVHELGHFWVAKKNGILVEEFGFGLPPRIWGKKVGETIYSINLLPIGGFVKLYGEEGTENEELRMKNEEFFKRAFFVQSKLVRAAVLLAGVTMNFLLGAVLFSAIYSVVGIPTNVNKIIVTGEKPGSLAVQVGFQPRDVIKQIKVGEQATAVAGVDDFIKVTDESRGKEVVVLVDRGGEDKQLVYSLPETEDVYVSGVVPGSPAAKAGLKSGDRIVQLEAVGEKIDFVDTLQFVERVNRHKGREVTLKVLRGGGEMVFTLVPREKVPKNEGALGVYLSQVDVDELDSWGVPHNGAFSGVYHTSWGLAVSQIDLLRYPFWQMPLRGAWFGLKEAVVWGGMIFMGVVRMVSNLLVGVLPADVGGPLKIYQATGEVAKSGLLLLLQFVAVLSVNLAVLNVLPLPALDGGRLLFLGIETVFRRRLDQKFEQITHAVGMIVLLSLMVVITLNDIVQMTNSGSLWGLVQKVSPL